MSGTITFSIEIELGWGVTQYNKLDVLSPNRQVETRTLEQLLDVCDELTIPITFNIVGHLLHDNPLEKYDGGHKDGRFSDIPITGSEDDPLFYAPDLVRRIQRSSVDHEICTHTFTHVECANVSPERLRWEFDRTLEAHEEFGLERPTSLVPPCHSPPPKEVLRDYGIEIVRMSRSQTPELKAAASRARLAMDILTGVQPIMAPQMCDDVLETYCTKFPSLTAPFLQSGQKKPHPLFMIIPRSLRKRLHSYNLEQTLYSVIQEDSYVHVWSHLWEMSNNIQWPHIENFLRTVSYCQTRGNINIRTMEELNRCVRSG